jgi:lipoprotein-anchoring transpeptidase ErfK/SrfK
MSKPLARTLLLALALCAFMTMAVPAFAEGRGIVPNHAYVGSVDLYGMEESAAVAAISQEASVTSLPKLRTLAAGMYFTLDTPKYVRLDVEGMLERAYAPSVETSFTVPRMANITTPSVVAFVDRVAAKVNRRRASAFYYVRNSRMQWRSAVYGRGLYMTESRGRVMRALRAEIPTGTAQPTVHLPYKRYTPAVTNAKLGRAILVDLSQRKLRLYDHSKLIKKVGVAVGMPRYPTPRGKFKIIAKNPHPAWRNPGSDWAANMPAYIPPGPSNPLGLRALYVNSPGIRIHGTYKTWTIGTAASHGCMRVANSQIVKLYPLVPVGTPVFIIK